VSHGIQLQSLHRRPIRDARLKLAAETALDQAGDHRGVNLSIIVTDSATLREYNRQHRQIDAATDVLSFAAAPLPAAIDTAPGYLGDIIIAHDYVAAQCEARGCCLNDALCLLVIHGTLHLLGYDHDSDSARAQMWRAQAASLQSLGISPTLVQDYAAAGDG